MTTSNGRSPWINPGIATWRSEKLRFAQPKAKHLFKGKTVAVGSQWRLLLLILVPLLTSTLWNPVSQVAGTQIALPSGISVTANSLMASAETNNSLTPSASPTNTIPSQTQIAPLSSSPSLGTLALVTSNDENSVWLTLCLVILSLTIGMVGGVMSEKFFSRQRSQSQNNSSNVKGIEQEKSPQITSRSTLKTSLYQPESPKIYRQTDLSDLGQITPKSTSLEAVSISVSNLKAVTLKPLQYKQKDEDIVRSIVVADGRCLVTILADGASGFQLGAQEYAGGGMEAAEVACETAAQVLSEGILADHLYFAQIVRTMQRTFSRVNNILIQNNRKILEDQSENRRIPGGTTLLIGMLVCEKRQTYWCYGYSGNGQIVLMSPRRMIGEYLSEVQLLTPQEGAGATVTLPYPTNVLIEPVIGFVPYRPNDYLFLSSDGMNSIDKYLRHHMGLTLANYLWKNFVKENISSQDMLPTLPDVLNDPAIPTKPTISIRDVVRDDATLSLIWTQEKK